MSSLFYCQDEECNLCIKWCSEIGVELLCVSLCVDQELCTVTRVVVSGGHSTCTRCGASIQTVPLAVVFSPWVCYTIVRLPSHIPYLSPLSIAIGDYCLFWLAGGLCLGTQLASLEEKDMGPWSHRLLSWRCLISHNKHPLSNLCSIQVSSQSTHRNAALFM